MIFEALNESLNRGELLLVEGGMARFHLRRDGQLTMHEILVIEAFRRSCHNIMQAWQNIVETQHA